MKLLLLPIFFLSVVVPTLAFAQQPRNFDPSQVQEMMKKFQDPAAMQKMQQDAKAAEQCTQGISRTELDALRARGEAARREIERLCAAGKESEALAKGLSLSKDLHSNATVRKLRECSEKLSKSMQDMPWAKMGGIEGIEDDSPPTANDICS